MAEEAKIYGILWRPEENNIKKAKDLIEPIAKAIAEMKVDPERFKKLEAVNGWGTYENFVPWLEKYLAACLSYPDSSVSVWI